MKPRWLVFRDVVRRDKIVLRATKRWSNKGAGLMLALLQVMLAYMPILELDATTSKPIILLGRVVPLLWSAFEPRWTGSTSIDNDNTGVILTGPVEILRWPDIRPTLARNTSLKLDLEANFRQRIALRAGRTNQLTLLSITPLLPGPSTKDAWDYSGFRRYVIAQLPQTSVWTSLLHRCIMGTTSGGESDTLSVALNRRVRRRLRTINHLDM